MAAVYSISLTANRFKRPVQTGVGHSGGRTNRGRVHSEESSESTAPHAETPDEPVLTKRPDLAAHIPDAHHNK